ncbi:MAG TPA: branched-chain amino acid ABC transporter substrate-binding protein [Candidatus Limnocylindria bacterium]|jgi:branched-chain amino acid transport system substrate-binding protein|nr:branched-chain amino acid ABC transporter substrate-binding protein [Candidatus Limnocylindria bacterium]
MQKHLREIGVLAVMLLAVAACTPTGGASTSAGASASGGGAAAACAADKFGCVTVESGAPIVLGTSLVISGANSSLGLDSQYGAQVALNLRGQVLGHDVELDNQDDGCSADGGTASANLLKSKPEIVAVLGTSCSSAGEPASQILSEAGILTVSPSNTAPSLTDPATHQPFYARTAHNDKIQGAAMAQFACEVLKVKSAATIHDGSPYAQQLQQVFADNFKSECGGKITDQEAITVGQTDFSSVLSSIATSNDGAAPDFLYYPIFIAEGALITQQAAQNSALDKTIRAGADGIFSPDFVSAAGDGAEGMYFSGPDLAFSGNFYEDTFLPEYQKVSGEDEPTAPFHAHAFDAINMILDAVEKVAIDENGTLSIPRTALRDAFFATSGYKGITGTLTCDENGDCADAKISVSQLKNGKYVRIWP